MIRRIIITLMLLVASFSIALADSVLNLKKSLTDNSRVYPESYDTNVDNMMKVWWENGYIEMENRHAGKIADATDEVIAERLSKMPTAIEMPYNQVVGKFIKMYINRKSLVENMLGISLYYMPIFERALESRGMPLELKYLPVIESALNPVAVSRAGAAGLWQFMPSTGRGVGLEISSLVDERLDPIKSSEKAADYLKQLYGIYNDWSLAIAAYNCGPGNVNKALRRAGGQRGNDFWTIYNYLPSETRGYVPAFIAANYIMTYYNQHGISPSLAKRPLVTDTVHVNNRVHFQQIAEVLDIPVSEIKILNPQYRHNEIPGDIRSYSLTLPSRQILAYIMFEDSILNHRAEEFSRRRVVEIGESSNKQSDSGDYVVETVTKQVTTHHTVRKKETLSSVAKRYGVKASDLQRWNGLRGGKVKRGQKLKIIQTKKVTVRRPKPKQDTETDSSETSTAQNEDSNGDVINGDVPPPPAKPETKEVSVPAPHSSSASTVKNKSTDVPAPRNTKKETKTQNVPEKSTAKKSGKATSDKTSNKNEVYEIQAGDRLEWIAKKNGVTVDELKKANNMTDDKIIAGKDLIIPKKATTKGKSSTTKKDNNTKSKSKSSAKTSSKNSSKGKASSKSKSSKTSKTSSKSKSTSKKKK